mmetsp:Transcript_31167/g.78432  ORF Transcript_31167/g.78432 Transcript_31167/m.78432 type:complete len:219 (+) Transcript_31167:2-658(+)
MTARAFLKVPGFGLESVAWSPDSTLLVCKKSNWSHKVITVLSRWGEVLCELDHDHRVSVCNAIFSPDGKRIAYGQGDGIVRILNMDMYVRLYRDLHNRLSRALKEACTINVQYVGKGVFSGNAKFRVGVLKVKLKVQSSDFQLQLLRESESSNWPLNLYPNDFKLNTSLLECSLIKKGTTDLDIVLNSKVTTVIFDLASDRDMWLGGLSELQQFLQGT